MTAIEGTSLGINEENAEKFSVYPNPASDVLYVSSIISEPYTVTIFDSFGKQQLLTQHVQNHQATMDVSSLSSGLFFVEIRTKTAKTVQKIVIQ